MNHSIWIALNGQLWVLTGNGTMRKLIINCPGTGGHSHPSWHVIYTAESKDYNSSQIGYANFNHSNLIIKFKNQWIVNLRFRPNSVAPSSPPEDLIPLWFLCFFSDLPVNRLSCEIQFGTIHSPDHHQNQTWWPLIEFPFCTVDLFSPPSHVDTVRAIQPVHRQQKERSPVIKWRPPPLAYKFTTLSTVHALQRVVFNWY